MNQRPFGPQPNALPDCATPRRGGHHSGILALGLAIAVLAAAAGPASAAPLRDCGNYGYPEGHQGNKPVFTQERIVGAGVYDIRARVASCRTARRMVRRFWNGRWGNCDPTCRRGRFTCRNRQVGDEVWIMRCTAKGGRVVRFEHGA